MAVVKQENDRRTVQEGNFFSREFKEINISTLTNADAAQGNAALLAAISKIEAVASVIAVGAFTAGTDTEVNVLIEGMDFDGTPYAGGTQSYAQYLAALTGETVAEVAF